MGVVVADVTAAFDLIWGYAPKVFGEIVDFIQQDLTAADKKK